MTTAARRAQMREYARHNRDRINATRRSWRENNRDWVNQVDRVYRRRNRAKTRAIRLASYHRCKIKRYWLEVYAWDGG